MLMKTGRSDAHAGGKGDTEPQDLERDGKPRNEVESDARTSEGKPRRLIGGA